ncbi:Pectin lyase-like superfamily protein [Rhynchospora pubera]|uniref:Pectin lyase-like superfamily protein n=1 Tax=Rhynchospora pubera TaxID=906938 RepID=A0AAV8DWV6_9POAL|nr:Pectin lyase-like superfamily protein [Rhynchospora pubera]KAJ4787675.1 Pectin lyase-like superfamily protein [Rhynchospora pubera]
MRKLRAKSLVLLLLLVIVCFNSIDLCEGRRGKHWRPKKGPFSSLTKKKGKGKTGSQHSGQGNAKPKPSPSPSPNQPVKPSLSPKKKPNPSPPQNPKPSPNPGSSPSMGQGKVTPVSPTPIIYNVLDFGAQGDGVCDDTKAFEDAWAEACKEEASTVLVPADYQFLVGPISFSGPYCKPNIVFQLEGTIIAPTNAKAWGEGLLQWLEFTKLRGITIRGKGVIEGRGSVWWTGTDDDLDPVDALLSEKMPSIKPTALRFYGSYNVTVTGITIQNSPQCHLKFDNCESVAVYNISISSPGNSLNTDGIHLQNSKDVNIHHNNLSCGDDCVSIQTGCTNINVHSLDCGPGHGISIGGLGRDNSKACVANVTVRDINMHNTMSGVRIKTWQGGSGLVENVRFSNIRVSEVQTPIVIDQFYCDHASCKNQTQGVLISGVHYENIRGTFTVKPVHFACSDNTPCSDISLTNVQLQPMKEQFHMYDPFCWQAYGELFTPTVPPIMCLQNGKPASNRVLSDHDTC